MQTKYNPKAPKGQVSDNRNVAETWAKLGFRVMPLRWREETLKNGKVRKAKSPIWEGYATKATTDLKKIRRVWGGDPKLLVGVLTEDFTVVDLDRHGEKDGFVELGKMGAEVASDFVARTAGNGEHYLFANVPEVVSSNGGVAPGIDVKARTGNGVPSYIVAPGTVTPWGRYEWLKGDAESLASALKAGALPPVPKALRTYKRPFEPGQGEPTGLPFHVIRDALMKCPNDGDAYSSREAWVHMVMAVHCETGGSEEGREAVHEWSRQHPSYDADHTDALWDSCKADRGLTGWHIIHEAERHDWRDDAVTELRHMELLDDFEGLVTPIYDDWDATELDEIDALVGGPSDRSGGLTFLSPSDCAATPARAYIIKGLLAQGDVAAIVGAPGAGKSLFAPRLGYAVAQGAEVFGRRVKTGGVFYVAAEDGHGMRGRVQAMEAEHGDAPDFKVVEGVSDLLSKQGQLKALQRAVKERRPALVVIDTLAVAFPGLEENDAKGMGQVVAAARSLTKWGAAVVLIHHDTKSGDGLPRGHSLLNGALDVALYLKREDGVVSVKPSKNRNGTTEQELAFTVGVREIGTDEDGDAITAAICEEADSANRARSPNLPPSAQAALTILRDLGKGQFVPEDTWRDACVEGRKVSQSEDPDSRKKAFRRAVGILNREGVVIFAEGKFVERYSDNEQFTEDYDDV